MIRLALALLALSPAPALAHAGHLAEIAGHSHWIAAGALAAATALTLWAKGKRDREEPAAEEAEDDAEEAQEA